MCLKKIKNWYNEQKEKQYEYLSRTNTITNYADSRETRFVAKVRMFEFTIGILLTLIVLFLNISVHFTPILNVIFSSYYVDAVILDITLCRFIQYLGLSLIYKKEHPIKFNRLEEEDDRYKQCIMTTLIILPILIVFFIAYTWYIIKICLDGFFVWNLSFELLFKNSYNEKINNLGCIIKNCTL